MSARAPQEVVVNYALTTLAAKGLHSCAVSCRRRKQVASTAGSQAMNTSNRVIVNLTSAPGRSTVVN